LVTQTRDKAWYKYTYTLNANLFEKDGVYKVIITTKDSAGNINENIIEGKKANINFAIDKTAPVVAVTGLKEHTIYDSNEKQVHIDVDDNIAMDSVEVILNGETMPITKEEFSFTVAVSEKNSLQNMKIIAKDKAGNTSIKEINDFTVSSNFFVRWYLNRPLFIGSLISMAMIVLLIIFAFKKRKDKEATNETNN